MAEKDGVGLALVVKFGSAWLIDDGYASAMEAQLDSMTLADVAAVHMATRSTEDAEGNIEQYDVSDGIAYIRVNGPLTKNMNSMQQMFGGASTVAIENALETAVADKAVRSVMLVMDSPGGTVDGSFDLAQKVWTLNRQKPIDGYAEDNCCSAAYLVLSQCRTISANINANVGSIGVYTELQDTTKADAIRGVKRHVIFAGKNKAIGHREVTDEHIAVVQARMDKIMGLFAKAVMHGRGMTEKQLAKVATGDVFIGSDAKHVGLIDKVETLEAAHKAAVSAPTKTGGRVKGTNMADTNGAGDTDLTEVRQWLASNNDDTPPVAQATTVVQDVVAAAAVADITPPVIQQVPQMTITMAEAFLGIGTGMTAALIAAGMTDPAKLQATLASAVVGDDYVAKLRKQTKQLAIIALGPTDGAAAGALVDASGVELVRAMATQYEGIAVAKGLVPPRAGEPMKRGTAAVGHPEVGEARATANNSAARTPEQEQVAAAHIHERAATHLYAL